MNNRTIVKIYKPTIGGGGPTEPNVDLPLNSNGEVIHNGQNLKLFLDNLENQIADALYEELLISSFSVTPNRAELGSNLSSLTFNWGYNKSVASQSINNGVGSITPSLRTATPTGLSVTSTRTYTLTAEDDRELQKTANATIEFMNAVYYGSKAQGSYDSAFILSLGTKVLQPGRTRTFNINIATGQYLYYAYPANRGYGDIAINGFFGDVELVSDSISFTNSLGYTENYILMKSTHSGLGNINVEVT